MLIGHKQDFRLLKEINVKLLIIIISITLFGILNIYLCTKGGVFSNPFLYVKKQIVWFLISMIGMYFLLSFDYKAIYEYVPIIYWITVVLLIAVWIPGIGAIIKGERGWINLRFFLLQPAEVAKFSIILMLARQLEEMKCEINNWDNLKKIILYAAIPMGLILIQKDMGMTMVCFFIVLGMVYIAGLYGKVIIGGFIAIIMSIIILWNTGLILQHQKDRILEFIGSSSDASGGTYQLSQGITGVGYGGFLGTSLSLDPQASPGYTANNVPEVQTDFIFTAIAEQWGFVGSLLLLFLYGVLIKEIINTARNARDKFGELICVGMGSYFLFAVTENIGMTLGLLPITGITLPFISYGGSSLCTIMIAISLVLNIGMRRKKINF